MVDFLKIHLTNPHELFKRLDAEPLINGITGELVGYKPIIIGGCLKIQLVRKGKGKKNEYLEIAGSIHKFSNTIQNKGKQNHQDITFNSLITAIEELNIRLPFNVHSGKIISLEYGLNILVDENPTDLLNQKVTILKNKAAHKGRVGTTLIYRIGKRELKLYDKTKESKLDYQMIRIETRLKREQLNNNGIDNVYDLLIIKNLQRIHSILIDDMDALTIVDSIHPPVQLSERYKRIYQSFTIEEYYPKGIPSSTRADQKKIFKRILEEYKLDTTKTKLLNQISPFPYKKNTITLQVNKIKSY